jgi:hypothetical protein
VIEPPRGICNLFEKNYFVLFALVPFLVAFEVVVGAVLPAKAVTAPKVRAKAANSGISFFIFVVLLWIATNYVVLGFMIANGT